MARLHERSSQTDVPQDVQKKIEFFSSWCRGIGIDMARLRICSTVDRGLCVIATESIAANEIALCIPLDAVLTVAGVARSELGQQVLESKALGGNAVSAQALMYMAMIDGRARSESHWHPYLNLIPAEHSDPLWWSAAERERLLSGTQLLHDAARHEEQLREVYASLFPALSQELPSWFPAERYTFEAFRWARSSLSSRSFSDTVLENVLCDGSPAGAHDGTRAACTQLSPGEHARLVLDCPAILCPLLDLTNHDPGAAVRVGLIPRAQRTHVGISVQACVAAGCEVLNNYGNGHTNLQFLLGHGFCIPHNLEDTFPLRLGASRAVKGSAVKQRALQKCGVQLDELHQLSRQQPLPPRLLASLRILLLDDRSLARKMRIFDRKVLCFGTERRAFEQEDSQVVKDSLLDILTQPLKPTASEPHCELDVLDTLYQQLSQKKQAIDGKPVPAQAVIAERNAAHYRAGQLEVLTLALEAVDSAKQAWCRSHGFAVDGEEGGIEGQGEQAPCEQDPSAAAPAGPHARKRRRVNR